MTTPPALSPNALNFSGGPGALPESVLHQLQEAVVAVPGVGLSVLGISHRSDWFADVMAEAERNVRSLLGLGDSWRVLFLQGGATQQFASIAMRYLSGSATAADYLHTGYWSGRSLPEARRQGPVRVAWCGEGEGFVRLPGDEELSFTADAPYLHYVSNETVEGLQFHRVLGREGVPRIIDMSSDFLSAPFPAERFDMIYAHAQKNLGPAGVTLVVMREAMLARGRGEMPDFLDYRVQAQANSIYNTPPVFAIYVVLLVTRWLMQSVGGLSAMGAINARKAARLYQVIDESAGFYRGHARPADRSTMNVVFRLKDAQADAAFARAAQAAGFAGLAGHRSLGGLRASLYNGLSLPAVEALADFMDAYRRLAPA